MSTRKNIHSRSNLLVFIMSFFRIALIFSNKNLQAKFFDIKMMSLIGTGNNPQANHDCCCCSCYRRGKQVIFIISTSKIYWIKIHPPHRLAAVGRYSFCCYFYILSIPFALLRTAKHPIVIFFLTYY